MDTIILMICKLGGHCGICGAWIPNIVVEKYWAIGVCDNCRSGKINVKTYKGGVEMFRHNEVCENCTFWQNGYCEENSSFTKSFKSACWSFVRKKRKRIKNF